MTWDQAGQWLMDNGGGGSFGVGPFHGETPDGPCCFGCGAGEYSHCTCPPYDEAQYLDWWRAAVDAGHFEEPCADSAHGLEDMIPASVMEARA